MQVSECGAVTAAELARYPLFAEDEAEALAWISARMRVLTLDGGEVFVEAGQPVTDFVFVLEGEMHYERENDPFGHRFIRVSGQSAGLLPFSRMKVARGRGRAVGKTRLALMDGVHLRELVWRAPCAAQKLVAEMTDRTRETTQLDERANKLLALGKLAAGLAHELNNPASAVVRAANVLRGYLEERRRAESELLLAPGAQEAAPLLKGLSAHVADCGRQAATLDPLARNDLESEMSDALAGLGLPEEWASQLVESGIQPHQLRELSARQRPDLLKPALRVFILDHQLHCLGEEMEEASQRIFHLVRDIKTYSYMDQTPLQSVDLRDSLHLTLRLLQHRLKDGAEVSLSVVPDLPRVFGNGSELNQVWTNLLDNAIDAMQPMAPESRRLSIRAGREMDCVLVEIEDNGPGIPKEIQGRIFEPFFTTKSVGQGTGLGLDIVQQIVRRHGGSIHLDSEPGRTRFQIRLKAQ